MIAQSSTTNYTAPATPQPRAQQAPLSRTRQAAEFNAVRVIRLGNLTEVERQRTQEKKNFRIGIARHLPRPIESLNEFTAQTTPQGTLYLLRLVSPEAQSLRVHFKTLQLPEGTRLFVSSQQNPDIFSPPYTGTRRDFWTPMLPGEEILIECFVPNTATLEKAVAPFQIDAVNHIFRAPRASGGIQPEAAGNCNQPVPDEFREAAKATALIAFAKPDGEYACTGTLLADIKKTGTPYFLTANHCISNGGEASSAEVYWNYDSGSQPTTPPTRGASLLVTDEADDFTLLQLNAQPPGGVVYSGWTSVAQPVGTAVTGIHHPQADYKRASFGKLVEASCPAEIPAEFCEFYAKVQWERGLTEPGSSGSGIFIGTGSQTQLVGLLSGGESSCENPTGVDFYGRMNRIFGALGFYLTNGEVCRYTLLQDRFAFGQAGGNGEFTVVPKIGGENCPWQGRSNVAWITFTNASGNGLGKVTFQVAPNTSNQPRLGAISIAGRNVFVVQNPTIASDDPCAPARITANQTVTGDLRTTSCRSWFDSTQAARRYSFEGEAGRIVNFNFQQFPGNSQVHLIGPDGVATRLQNFYGIALSATGTQVLEIAFLPSETLFPGAFSFSLFTGCQYRFSRTYVEVDGFGQSFTDPTDQIRIDTEVIGSNCGPQFTTSDEPGIDNNLQYAPFNTILNALFMIINPATDPKQRYAVYRVAGQPIIVKQTPRCSSLTTLAYTPSELNLAGTGGEFQMQVKRVTGPTCSWEINPYEVYGNQQWGTTTLRLQPENSFNRARGTGDGTVAYKLPANTKLSTDRYVLKHGDTVAQTITQTAVGASCTRTPLQVGQTINGALTTSDCAWSEPSQYLDQYQLNVVEGEQYVIELTGTAGSEITADWGWVEYGGTFALGDLRQTAQVRWPATGTYTVPQTATYLLRVYGKPGSYQLKMSGVGPAGCVYRINKEGDILVPANTTSLPVQLDCNRSDCDWTAQSTANWITLPNGGTGRGSQTITLTLAPNTDAKRQATVTIAGRVFNLIQDFACSYRKYFTAAPKKFFAGFEGGEYSYYVETGTSCPLPVITSNTAWLTVTAESPTNIRVKVTANTGGFRKTTAQIAGEEFEVQQGGNDLVVTTGADYQRTVAPGSLVSVFNQGMTPTVAAAQTLPLPTTLAGVEVYIELPGGNILVAPLLYASPTQINFLLPETTPIGRVKIRLWTSAMPYGGNGSGHYAVGEFEVAAVTPNIFTADSTGKGPAAADIQRIRPGQAVVYERTYTTIPDEQGNPVVVARPVTIGTGDEKTYLVLYATGLRKRNANAAVTAQIGEVTVPVEYAGAQGQFVGLDQINILLPPSLRGKGLVNVTVTMDGKTTNSVQINIAP